MINPIQASLLQADGSERYVIIEPILDKDDRGQLAGTGQYKIYKDAFGDQTLLFTEPNESLAKNDLPDSANPDYLGSFSIDAETGEFIYEGMVILTDDELQQAGKLILNKLDSGTSYNS
ncbi:hypothetical protein [Mucilaginibacter sp.]|uniref:hypothetical protein n=1 Tax=Mucilaginibacter sp. TaxID=1882438 RepID=UPI003D0D7AD0